MPGDSNGQTKRLNKLQPHFFTSGWFYLSEEARNVFCRFDIGQGQIYPVEILEEDRKTRLPIKYYCVNFANVKSCLLPEQSKDIKENRYVPGKWVYRDYYKDIRDREYGIVVTPAALQGPDMWLAKNLSSILFLSDRLVQGLKAAGVDRDFNLFRCKVLDQG